MTTPITVSTVESFVGHWINIIKAHEKLLLAVIATLLLWHFGDMAYNAYGKHLNAAVTADNAQIAQVEKSNADLTMQIATLKASVDAQAAISQARIVADKQKIIATQKIDATLPMPELSKHIEELEMLPSGSLTPQPNGTVAVTPDAVHLIANELEKVGPLTDELVNTTAELTSCNVLRGKQDTLIAGLNTDITAEKKARGDEAKQAKHDIRSAYFKGLKHGVIVGVVATVAVLHL
jgi:hypothetical protein